MGIIKKLADQEYVAQEVATKVNEAMEQFDQSSLPPVTADNNGAFLRVVDGAWAVETIPSAEGASF